MSFNFPCPLMVVVSAMLASSLSCIFLGKQETKWWKVPWLCARGLQCGAVRNHPAPRLFQSQASVLSQLPALEAQRSTEESASRLSGVSKFVAETMNEVPFGGEPRAASLPGTMCSTLKKEFSLYVRFVHDFYF